MAPGPEVRRLPLDHGQRAANLRGGQLHRGNARQATSERASCGLISLPYAARPATCIKNLTPSLARDYAGEGRSTKAARYNGRLYPTRSQAIERTRVRYEYLQNYFVRQSRV